MEQKFFICEHCGNNGTEYSELAMHAALCGQYGVPVVCCGEKMHRIMAGSIDASKEKHVPVIEVRGNEVIVTVGSVAHPMEENHYIEWISLETKQGNQRKALKAGEKPQAKFALCADDEPIAAYAYCNLHGLWKAEFKA